MTKARHSTPLGDERRQALILAAYRIIAEKGFEGLRIQDVAANAGMNHATLYHYFPAKENLIQGVVEYLRQELVTPLDIPGSDYSTPLGTVRSMFLATHYRLQHTPEFIMVLSELILRSRRDQAIQEALKDMDSRWFGFLKHTLSRGVQEGALRADLDLDQATTTLMALQRGLINLSFTCPELLTVERIIEAVEKLLCG
ncbi:TetR/AcrR family transcriptional regulator [Ktedonosporobacter rubrisoli]|uniref:TetR/AcrR family transcriptional regulator n=1 Tax=Ktedonosporobacter rubrisoli TaxID=2509675 RepID=UPI0013EE6C2C|nr:TetR/AcrR family transcriptional regulator [Ktedonosporobacter rubrisoli]